MVAFLSEPEAYYLYSKVFYYDYGVMPVLAEAGDTSVFTPLQLTVAFLMGQAFHLLSPISALSVRFAWDD